MSSKPLGDKIQILDTGEVRVLGIDYASRDIRIMGRTEDTIALRVPGVSVWNGTGEPRKYVPAKVLVYSIVSASMEKSETLDVVPLIEWEDSRKTRERV